MGVNIYEKQNHTWQLIFYQIILISRHEYHTTLIIYFLIDDYTECHARILICSCELRLARTVEPFKSTKKIAL